MIVGKDREETIRLTAEALGCSLRSAAEIVAHEMGDPHAGDEVRIEVDVDDLDDDAEAEDDGDAQDEDAPLAD